MSEQSFVESFWAKIERDGGFKIGEMLCMPSTKSDGKTMIAVDYMIQVAKDNNIPIAYLDVECTKVRDYNGMQFELSFDDTKANHVE